MCHAIAVSWKKERKKAYCTKAMHVPLAARKMRVWGKSPHQNCQSSTMASFTSSLILNKWYEADTARRHRCFYAISIRWFDTIECRKLDAKNLVMGTDTAFDVVHMIPPIQSKMYPCSPRMSSTNLPIRAAWSSCFKPCMHFAPRVQVLCFTEPTDVHSSKLYGQAAHHLPRSFMRGNAGL